MIIRVSQRLLLRISLLNNIVDNKINFPLRASHSPQKKRFSINVNCFVKLQQTYSDSSVGLDSRLAPNFVG